MEGLFVIDGAILIGADVRQTDTRFTAINPTTGETLEPTPFGPHSLEPPALAPPEPLEQAATAVRAWEVASPSAASASAAARR